MTSSTIRIDPQLARVVLQQWAHLQKQDVGVKH